MDGSASAKKWWQRGYQNPGPQTLGEHPAAEAGSGGLPSPTNGGATPRGKVQAAFAPDRYQDFLGRNGKRTKRRRVHVGEEFRPSQMVGGADTPSPPRVDRPLRRLPSATSITSVTSFASAYSSDSDGRVVTAAPVGGALDPGGGAGGGCGVGASAVTARGKGSLRGGRRKIYVKPFVVRSAKGFRRSNEDRYVAHTSVKDTPPHSFFAVFDGHGGRRAAEYCTNHLYKNVVRDHSWPEQPIDALKAAVLKTDADFRKLVRESKDENQQLDGSTCISAMVVGKHLFVTNVGDSRAVLVRASGSVVALSTDHKPTTLAESVRIHKAGGTVEQERVAGVLSVSRSIGDEKLSHLVCAKPDIRPFVLKHPDDLIVLASDGLWDVIQNKDVLQTVHGSSMTTAAERLIAQAVLRGSKDNITVMIIHVGGASAGAVASAPSPFMPPPARRPSGGIADATGSSPRPAGLEHGDSPRLGAGSSAKQLRVNNAPAVGALGLFRDSGSETDSTISPATPMTPGSSFFPADCPPQTGDGGGGCGGGGLGAAARGAAASGAAGSNNPFSSAPSSFAFGAVPSSAAAAGNPFAAAQGVGAPISSAGTSNPFAAPAKQPNPFESTTKKAQPTVKGKSGGPSPSANSFVSIFVNIAKNKFSPNLAQSSGAGQGDNAASPAVAPPMLKPPERKPRVVKRRKFRRRLTVLVADSRAAGDDESPTLGARPAIQKLSMAGSPAQMRPAAAAGEAAVTTTTTTTQAQGGDTVGGAAGGSGGGGAELRRPAVMPRARSVKRLRDDADSDMSDSPGKAARSVASGGGSDAATAARSGRSVPRIQSLVSPIRVEGSSVGPAVGYETDA